MLNSFIDLLFPQRYALINLIIEKFLDIIPFVQSVGKIRKFNIKKRYIVISTGEWYEDRSDLDFAII